MSHPIEISQEALVAFRDKLIARGTSGTKIRLGIKGGGCSGYSYVIAYDDEPITKGSLVWREGNVDFIIDVKSHLLLSGSRVVFKKSFVGEGFEFENPREASKCGCGSSFAVKQ